MFLLPGFIEGEIRLNIIRVCVLHTIYYIPKTGGWLAAVVIRVLLIGNPKSKPYAGL